MTRAHVLITDDTLRKGLHRTIDKLLEERDALRREKDRAWSIANMAHKEYDKLEVDCNILRTLVEKVQCIQIVAHGEPYCPWCGFMAQVTSPGGSLIFVHQPNCECQARLKGSEE